MNKKLIWWILLAYSLYSVISGFFANDAIGPTGLAVASGAIVVLILFTRRYVPEMRKFVVKGFIGVSVIVTIISLIMAFKSTEAGLIDRIVGGVGSGVCSVLLILLANCNKLEFMETCGTKKFVIILIAAAILLPSIMSLATGFVSFVIGIALVIAFAFMMFSNVKFSDFRPTQQTYIDDKGYHHVTKYDAEKANEKYKAEKNND